MPDHSTNLPSVAQRPALLTVTAAAAELGVSRGHLYQLRARGQIGFAKCLGKTVVPRTELDRLLTDLGAQAASERGAA